MLYKRFLQNTKIYSGDGKLISEEVDDYLVVDVLTTSGKIVTVEGTYSDIKKIGLKMI